MISLIITVRISGIAQTFVLLDCPEASSLDTLHPAARNTAAVQVLQVCDARLLCFVTTHKTDKKILSAKRSFSLFFLLPALHRVQK